MSSKKVVVIGAGFVGSTITYALMLQNIADEVVLIDINEQKVKAEVADIRHGFASLSHTVVRAGTYADCSDSSLVVITAGVNRKVGETRQDLFEKNKVIITDICAAINKTSTSAVVLMVSNPVDGLTAEAVRLLSLPEGKVFGTGCSLDSSRLVCLLADRFNEPVENISAFVVGEHGENQRILWDDIRIAGKPVLFTQDEKAEIAATIRNAGMDIIKAKGKTHYGIASCVCELSRAVLRDEKLVTSVSFLHNKESVFCESRLCLVGKERIEKNG